MQPGAGFKLACLSMSQIASRNMLYVLWTTWTQLRPIEVIWTASSHILEPKHQAKPALARNNTCSENIFFEYSK